MLYYTQESAYLSSLQKKKSPKQDVPCISFQNDIILKYKSMPVIEMRNLYTLL
jgi:hypothetical protein